jgi:hypothetical protein
LIVEAEAAVALARLEKPVTAEEMLANFVSVTT